MSRRKGVWILCVPGAGSRQNPHVRELPLSWWFRCRGAGGIRFCMTAAAHTVVKTPGGYLMAYGASDGQISLWGQKLRSCARPADSQRAAKTSQRL
jgi:hypothetical protein